MPVNSENAKYRDRLVAIEQEAKDIASARKDLSVEMRSSGLTKSDIAGVKLAVRRHFELPEQRAERESEEAIAEALGAFSDSPLGVAAVCAAR